MLAAALLAIFVAGCGFGLEPLHGSKVNESIAGVEVPPIQGRAGELLHRALVDRLSSGRHAKAPIYQLHVALTSVSSPLVIDQSTFVRRYDVHLRAHYRLVEISTGREIGSAERNTRANHGVIPNEIYSTLVGSQAALRQAANVLANAIATDAVFLIRAEPDG